MTEFQLSYREVIPDQTIIEQWKEINLNTGGTQSILQDIKFVDRANGFCYKDSTKHYTRNRIIYWRISNDVLELVEHSLDINLSGNRVRYRFIDTPILDGISIYETYENVIVLVPTVCSVHRLVFPHPEKFHRADDLLGIHADLSAPSIFCEASDSDARNTGSYYVFSGPSFANSQLPHLASSTLTLDEKEAIFVLVYPTGELLLVRQILNGESYCVQLKNDSIVPRFLSGLAEKFRSKINDGDSIVSLVLHSVGQETYAITLSRDGQLKFWSCTKVQCVAAINILSETGDYSSNLVQGAQNHILRKAVNGFDEDCLLTTFLCYSSQSQFHILKPIFDNDGHIRVVHISSMFAPENDLIDFNLTLTRIWSVWRNEDGDCAVYSTCLQQGDNEIKIWTPVILEDQPESQPPQIDGESDPSQVYLQYIFHPGRFPLHIINKALNIYKRSTIVTDIHLSPGTLKQRIRTAVHNEIQKELKENEVSDEDYLECANWCWQRFYSCCEQYHYAGLKPLGILLLPCVSGAVLLKKSTFSFLRPLDTLEHMLLCSNYTTEDQFLYQSALSEDLELVPEVISLMEVIVYLEVIMNDTFGQTFEKELQQLRSPDVIMKELLDRFQSELDSEFTRQVANMLNKCQDLYQAMHKLLELIRDDHNTVGDEGKNSKTTLAHLFNSQLGVAVVTQCIHQQASTRFSICRNLLLICNILLVRQELDWEILEAIRSVCTPEIVVLTQASYVILWLSALPALPVLSHESPLRRLAPLKLNPVFNLRNNKTLIVSVLELFVGSSGGHVGHRLFSQKKHDEELSPHWHSSLLPYLSHLFRIIWPISGCPLLAEWLLSSGQHVWLQQYVRLLKNWCEWNNCTRNFLLGCSFLIGCENYKAMELFESAAKGIFTDTFLIQKILKDTTEDNPTKSYISYYLKVIQLFELNNASDCAINIANAALSVVNSDDPLAATLYSIKFKHHLKLKHYSYAYDSLNSNPDEDRRRDNLRDLVKCLLDEKKLDTLMSFNYGKLGELFCDILLSRARAVDLVNNVFYDFLYSYHIKRGPPFFRLAGSVMYEQAFRLLYNNNVEALEKQVKCYLAAINILQLCDEKYCWVVRPKESEEEEIIILATEIESDDEPITIVLENQLEVVGVNEIRKEFQFACAKLKLAKFCPAVYDNLSITGQSELVVALISAGLYQVALTFCGVFKLSYDSVFESLTRQCILLTEDESPEVSNWEWLLKNDTQDLLIYNNTPADVAWLLLENLLQQYEEPGLTIIHKVICKKIIQMGSYIPHWILSSYKTRNAAELLKLLHSSGRLEEAIEIAGQYMLAVMGHGKEYFGLTSSLSPTGPVMYTPSGSIYNLIIELEMQQKHNAEPDYKREHAFLKELFDRYLVTATRISNEMCKYRYTIAK